MRGDLHALERLSKADRRANRIQRRLDRRLRKREARRGLVRPAGVQAWRCRHKVFARAALWPSKEAARYTRRLLRGGGYHAAEVGGGLEHGAWGSVVSPRTSEAALNAAVATATKLPGSPRLSAPLPLLRVGSALGEGAVFGPEGSFGVSVRVARPSVAPVCLLVASDVDADTDACPIDLGLDETCLAELQAAAARLLNLRLELRGGKEEAWRGGA